MPPISEFSYFKTLSVGPVWVLNPDLLHSSPALIHMSQSGGYDFITLTTDRASFFFGL